MVKKLLNYQGWELEASFQSSVGMKFNMTSPVKVVVAEVNDAISPIQKLQSGCWSAVAAIALGGGGWRGEMLGLSQPGGVQLLYRTLCSLLLCPCACSSESDKLPGGRLTLNF